MARPTKYKKKYCSLLIEHMRNGLSFDAFAGVIEVNQDTLHEWKKRHKEFDKAYQNGKALSQLWWEQIGKAGATGQLTRAEEEIDPVTGRAVMKRVPTTFNAATWIFNMKNRFNWRDKQEVENIGEAKTKVTVYLPEKKDGN
jgi:hypothetical protein